MKNYVKLECLGYVLPQELSVGYLEWPHTKIKLSMGKTVGELHVLLIEYEKGLPKKAETPQVMMIKGDKIQKSNKKSLKAKGKGKANGKGKDNQVYIRKPKNPNPSAKDHPAKDDTCHHYKEVGHCKRNCPAYLAELIKKIKQVGTASSSCIFIIELFSFPTKSWVYDTSCGTHICNTKHNLGGVRKLKQLEAIGSFDLVLPNDLVICLDNFSKNNVHYFNVIPSNGVYEIDMHNLVPNVNSIYNKRIEKLQQEGLLKSTDDESFDQWRITLRFIGTDVHVSRQGASYFITFTDDYSRYGYVYLLKHKHEQLTPPYTPQHNRVSERRNRTLLDMVRSMMNLTTLPLSFWDYALEFATRILNMVPTKKVDKTLYELWYGKVPNLSYLKVWGCEALVKRDTPDKLQQRSVKHAEFFEKNLITQEVSERAIEEDIPIRRSERTRRAPNHLCLNVEAEEHSLGDLNEPTSYKAAMLDSESNKWIDAMNAEIQSMMDNMKMYAQLQKSIMVLSKHQEAGIKDLMRKSKVGSIMYVVRCTRPDVAFAQNITSRFQQNPGEPHWTAVKTILKYLRNTKDMFLVYGRNTEAELRVDCSCNAGFETDRDEIKSHT
ncbi:retrotransposon protein, putative, ty1-copia subclass [Tanacetum coccineum]|uniref:Retrotransposon protein, putative, ty1-copia subclass n=1 Tax=Tanacetum coccineum TaxID=301880 RepID=A0ABQ5HXB6_9ASTR